MIKTNEGKVELKGSQMELMADVGCIIHSLRDTLVENEVPREEAEEMLKKAVELGLKTDEEIEEDSKKKLGEFLKKMCKELIEAFEEEEEQ